MAADLIYRFGEDGYYSYSHPVEKGRDGKALVYVNGTEVAPEFKEGFTPYWTGSAWENVKRIPWGTKYFKVGEGIKFWKGAGRFPKDVNLVGEDFWDNYYIDSEGLVREVDAEWEGLKLLKRIRTEAAYCGGNGTVKSVVVKGAVVCDIETRLAIADLMEAMGEDELVDYYYEGMVLKLSKEELKRLREEILGYIGSVKARKKELIDKVGAVLSNKKWKDETKRGELKKIEISWE